MREGSKPRVPVALLRTHVIGGCVGPRWVGKISPPSAFDSRTVKSVDSRSIDHAIQTHSVFGKICNENMAKGRTCEAGATWHRLGKAARSHKFTTLNLMA
jgi:hypothetical protein